MLLHKDGVTFMERVQHAVVSIKGTKDGLVFYLDDQVDFTELLEALERKLTDKQAQLLNGPDISVHIQLGKRKVSVAEKQALRDMLAKRPNLIITSFESSVDDDGCTDEPLNCMENVSTTVRAGQVLEAKGSLLLLGDVNPGGTVRSGGHIFVLGSLRGVAHAGILGNKRAIIAASHMSPTQLRIADAINRSPDGTGDHGSLMEFAYLSGKQIAIERMNRLYRVRPELQDRMNWQRV